MASVEIVAPVVLRVKRKRDEEPADTLVVSKIAKLDPLLSETDQKVFHFAATVKNQHQTDGEVLAQIEKHKSRSSLAKLNSLSGLTISGQQKQRREAKKELVATQRFKLVSEARLLETDSAASTVDKHQDGHGTEVARNKSVHVYDLEQESMAGPSCEDHSHPSSHHQGSGRETRPETKSEIMCNSTPMIRERLNDPSEYVYDLYYTKTCSIHDIISCNWSSVSAYSYQPELVHDIIASDEEECYEDEDDSNDEGNWRNDYPDEDSGSERSSCSEEENSSHCRYRDVYLGDDFGEEDGFLDGSYCSSSSQPPSCNALYKWNKPWEIS